MGYCNKLVLNLLICLLLSSSSGFLVFCRKLEENENGGDSPECLQKLIPCQPYLLKPKMATETCCLPLKEMVAEEAKCLCGVITNPAILQSFNVTEADALNLATACGANADVSLCKNATSPTTRPPELSPPIAHSPPNGSSSSTPSQKSEAAQLWSRFERSSASIALFVALIFLAFSA